MARVTVEDCLDHVDNRFQLVLVAAKRARQLMNQNAEPCVDRENDKATVIALREIAEGYITKDILDDDAQQAMLEENEAAGQLTGEISEDEVEFVIAPEAQQSEEAEAADDSGTDDSGASSESDV